MNSLDLFLADSDAFEKLDSSLFTKSLEKGIQEASPLAQTNCLEEFHSVLKWLVSLMLECIAGT